MTLEPPIQTRIQTPYDEQYPACAYTHAWLRIMSPTLDPDDITRILGVKPTEVQRVGEVYHPKAGGRHKISGWFLSTKGIVDSRDVRHHVDWILERVGDKREEFALFHSHGYRVDLCCRWDSQHGHGGPTLSSPQLLGLGELQIELWFDIYLD